MPGDAAAPTTRRTLAWVLRRRLAVQRLSSAALPTATEAVRLLTCVQAQDAPAAAWALGLRTRGATLASVLAEQATGTFLRTHVLRPTWHFVAADDLRWLLRLTSPRVESGMEGRHRQLGLDERALGRGADALCRLLAGTARTRRELGNLADPALPPAGEALGHLLLVAELRGVICSGPPRGSEHTYALVDEVVPVASTDNLDREEALRLLVLRFFTGHGPGTDRDLARWCSLTLTEVRRGLAALAAQGRLASVDVDGDALWFDPAPAARPTRNPSAYLLSAFDEAFLTYTGHTFPRSATQPLADRTRLFAQAGGGVVLVDGRDVGTFRRTLSADSVTVELRLDDLISPAEHDHVAEAARRYATFLGRHLTLA